MSKEISVYNWVSIVPDKMYRDWVKQGLIKNGSSSFTDDTKYPDGNFKSLYCYRDLKTEMPLFIYNKEDIKKAKKNKDLEFIRTYDIIKSPSLHSLNSDIQAFYEEVFTYVTHWLKVHGFVQLVSGSFSGGFCAESNPDSEVIKKWGGPLAKPENKVAQIKEKFGYVTVYFNQLTPHERKKIDRFSKAVEKKFDCKTQFC